MRIVVRLRPSRSLFVVLAGACLAVAAAVPAVAQTAKIMPIVDHIHLNVPDQAKGVEWYQKFFGGQTLSEAPDRLMYGDTRLIFLKNDKGQPSTGSALDHIGFSVSDLDAKMKELEAAGVKIVNPVRDVPGLFKLAFVDDPWGTRIEVVQDSEKLGFHHIHLRAPDPAATLAWYKEKFGGESAKLKDRIDGIKYTGVWVLAQRGEATPSEGRAIDHIGWRTDDLKAKTAELKAQNVKFTAEPRPLTLASGAVVNFAYVEGPAAAKIELVQR
jgi:lactoylglutathione lyase